jgi:N-formylglutamate amidohydrolase
MKKLILHIPHSSTNIPFSKAYVDDETKIQKEIIKLTDWYTDELFYSDYDEMIVTPFSRLFCDVERFENDQDEIMSKVGMGVLYERFDDDEVLRTVTPQYRENVIRDYYKVHHHRLTQVVSTQLEKEGSALIIDCHSFPSTPLLKAIEQSNNPPDFNIGTDLFHTPTELTEIAIDYFHNLGYSCGLDWPYSGTIVPMKYYKKNKNAYSIMLEVNRKLYLNESTNEKSAEFEKIKKVIEGFLNNLKDKFIYN